MSGDVKSNLTEALSTVVNAPSDENFCGFVLTYTNGFVVYGDIHMSTYVGYAHTQTNMVVSLSYVNLMGNNSVI